MRILDADGIKEILLASVIAGVCFGAPALRSHMFPEPTAIHEAVDQLPFLGSLIIGMTIVRLMQRKKTRDKDN